MREGPAPTALSRALAILGDPWTMLILKEAFNGTRRFGAFREALNIPRQTLSLRLSHLCHHQLLYRRHVSATHRTTEYALTAKALDLHDAMMAIWLWHQANPGDVDVLPFDIVHRDCGTRLRAVFCCMACGGPAGPETVRVEAVAPRPAEAAVRGRLGRRNEAAFSAAGQGDPARMVVASVVGDIPCNEILGRLFRGPCHLLGLSRELGLGLGVLRGRLAKLRNLGLIDETPDGRRVLYHVSARAAGFFPLLMSISAWGDRWCNDGQPPPEIFVHDCGALLRGRFACAHCGGWVTRDSVRVVARDSMTIRGGVVAAEPDGKLHPLQTDRGRTG